MYLQLIVANSFGNNSKHSFITSVGFQVTLSNLTSTSIYQNIFLSNKKALRQNYADAHIWMDCFLMPIYILCCIQFLCWKLIQTNIKSRSYEKLDLSEWAHSMFFYRKWHNYWLDQYKIFINCHKQITGIAFRSGTHCKMVHSLASLHKKGTATE